MSKTKALLLTILVSLSSQADDSNRRRPRIRKSSTQTLDIMHKGHIQLMIDRLTAEGTYNPTPVNRVTELENEVAELTKQLKGCK